MSDLYHFAQPFAVDRFRSNTKKLATMPNVTTTPKKAPCICCGKSRTEATGKHTKRGFVCGMCASPRRAA